MDYHATPRNDFPSIYSFFSSRPVFYTLTGGGNWTRIIYPVVLFSSAVDVGDRYILRSMTINKTGSRQAARQALVDSSSSREIGTLAAAAAVHY